MFLLLLFCFVFFFFRPGKPDLSISFSDRSYLICGIPNFTLICLGKSFTELDILFYFEILRLLGLVTIIENIF